MIWSQIERGAVWLAAVVAGLVALGWLTRKLWKMFKRFDRILELVELVEKEMRPNGGSSLRDAVNSTNAKLDATNDRLTSVDSRLTALETAKPMTINVGTQQSPSS